AGAGGGRVHHRDRRIGGAEHAQRARGQLWKRTGAGDGGGLRLLLPTDFAGGLERTGAGGTDCAGAGRGGDRPTGAAELLWRHDRFTGAWRGWNLTIGDLGATS